VVLGRRTRPWRRAAIFGDEDFDNPPAPADNDAADEVEEPRWGR